MLVSVVGPVTMGCKKGKNGVRLSKEILGQAAEREEEEKER